MTLQEVCAKIGSFYFSLLGRAGLGEFEAAQVTSLSLNENTLTIHCRRVGRLLGPHGSRWKALVNHLAPLNLKLIEDTSPLPNWYTWIQDSFYYYLEENA